MKKVFKVFFIIFIILGCNDNDHVIQGFIPGIHTRLGLVDRFGNGPAEYVFNKVPILCGYIKEMPQFNLIQDWLENATFDISVEYRIFQAVDHAEIYMIERMEKSSLLYHNIINFPITGGLIGDNCYHQLAAGTIMFTRNNAWIRVHPPYLFDPYDPDEIEHIARSIDSLIVAAPKVYRPDKVPAPNIKSIELLPPYPKDWGERTLVKVEATDTKSDTLRLRAVGKGYAIISFEGLASVYPDSIHPIFNTGDPNKFRFMAWVWNEDNVVALAEKEFAFGK